MQGDEYPNFSKNSFENEINKRGSEFYETHLTRGIPATGDFLGLIGGGGGTGTQGVLGVVSIELRAVRRPSCS